MRRLKDNRGIVSYIVFGLLTCGIYNIWVFYHLIRDINEICKEDGIKSSGIFTAMLFNVLTLGGYSLFWYYRIGDMLRRAAKRREIPTSISGGYLLLCRFVGFFVFAIADYVAIYQIFEVTNDLAADYNMRLDTKLALEAAEKENT